LSSVEFVEFVEFVREKLKVKGEKLKVKS